MGEAMRRYVEDVEALPREGGGRARCARGALGAGDRERGEWRLGGGDRDREGEGADPDVSPERLDRKPARRPGTVAKRIELRRHTDNEGDVLSDAGARAALEIGSRLQGGYALPVSTGAQRATQTLACFACALPTPVGSLDPSVSTPAGSASRKETSS